MVLRYFQHGFNYSQDGPGNRLVYHCQGCNMHCPWCSNPEGMSLNHKCSEKSIDEIVTEIISCQPMFFDGGGVTFTGGEASLQLEAINEILISLKNIGINSAIETNATNPELPKIEKACDYFYIDFKSPQEEKLKEVTGGNIKIIKRNIIEIGKKKAVHIRVPFIHSFNDSQKDIIDFVDFFKSLNEADINFDVEILPYHEYGKEKWESQGLIYTYKNGFVSKDSINEFLNKLKENNIKISKT